MPLVPYQVEVFLLSVFIGLGAWGGQSEGWASCWPVGHEGLIPGTLKRTWYSQAQSSMGAPRRERLALPREKEGVTKEASCVVVTTVPVPPRERLEAGCEVRWSPDEHVS